MNKRTKRSSQAGMVLPLVLVFVIVLSLFVFSMLYSRTETRQKNLITFHYLKAHYMAQSGIQHAMMKINLLPDEAFEAAARQYGICALDDNPSLTGVGGGGNSDLMDLFTSDLRSDDLGVPETSGWGYEVKKIKTIAAHRKGNRMVALIEIESHGWAIEGRGKLQKRTEIVKKSISVTKSG
ncbi:hypothetical protein HYY75_02860 [bacterium]|nr:hypothetical protein [bacterium]